LPLTLLYPSRRPTTTYPSPGLTLVAWRVEPPPRILAYTGPAPPDARTVAAHFSPHKLLPKLLLNERSKRPNPCRIGLITCPSTGQTASLVRSAIASCPIAPFTEHLKSKAYAGTSIHAHALEEAVTAFLRPPPPANHMRIPLNGSVRWNQAYMDSR